MWLRQVSGSQAGYPRPLSPQLPDADPLTTTAWHCPASMFVNDHNLTILDDVVDVSLEERVRTQASIHMMEQCKVRWVV